MNLDNELRAALRREPAPADFVAKVLARAEREKKIVSLRSPLWKRPATWALAAGLAISALIPVALTEHRKKQQERALEAKRQLMTALQITSTKLQRTKHKLQNTRHLL